MSANYKLDRMPDPKKSGEERPKMLLSTSLFHFPDEPYFCRKCLLVSVKSIFLRVNSFPYE